MSLADFNSLTIPQAQAGLFELLHSIPWSAKVASALPFKTTEAAIREAEAIFDQLSASEIVHSMLHHPALGAQTDNHLSTLEQSSLSASEAELRELHQLNEEYENKFGFIYLAFASGKSAVELITKAKQRLHNDIAAEFAIARGELKKITINRFARWLAADARALSLSTHVLDAVTGLPAIGIKVQLFSAQRNLLSSAVTDAVGRITDFTDVHALPGAVFSLLFAVGEYFTQHDQEAFYPEISINFRVSDPDTHYHVPLLLSPYSYSTYRGS